MEIKNNRPECVLRTLRFLCNLRMVPISVWPRKTFPAQCNVAFISPFISEENEVFCIVSKYRETICFLTFSDCQYAERHYAYWHYAKWHYAECQYTERHYAYWHHSDCDIVTLCWEHTMLRDIMLSDIMMSDIMLR